MYYAESESKIPEDTAAPGLHPHLLTLAERNMRKEDLRLAARLTANLLANVGKGTHVRMETLTNIRETDAQQSV